MTAALEGGEWLAACPGRTLPPEKFRYPFYRRQGGSQGLSGRAENLVPIGIRPRTVQSVLSRYTDCATRPTNKYNKLRKLWNRIEEKGDFISSVYYVDTPMDTVYV